jgi:hypothetical protein
VWKYEIASTTEQGEMEKRNFFPGVKIQLVKRKKKEFFPDLL